MDIIYKILLAAYIVIAGVAGPKISIAEILTVPADDLKSGFDYHMPYRGQTFMFSEQVLAEKLTVYLSANIYQSFTFHLLLTEIDTTNGVHPTKVLFESSPFVIPVAGTNDFIPYTADLGGILLSANKTYAFILDIFISLNQIDTDVLWQYSTLTGMNRDAVYPFGEYFYLEEKCTDSLTRLPCGGRSDHFAGSWVVEPSEDMGFVFEYTPVPPSFSPSSIELLLLKK